MYIESIEGNLSDLVGKKIISVEEHIEDEGDKEDDESWTKTDFVISTADGKVAIHWMGCSNGYYSESVSFCELNQMETF